MTDRMKAFDKCIDQLIDAVTVDMIHVDNMADDISLALKMKITREKRKKLEQIRKNVLEEFKTQVKEHIDEELKSKLNLEERFEEFDNEEQQVKKKPWRINGDPQHDTYAQRRQVYVDYIEKLQGAAAQLEMERKDLIEKLQ